MLQHGDEPAFDRAPERLLFRILVNMFCKTYLPVCGAARSVAEIGFERGSRRNRRILRHIFEGYSERRNSMTSGRRDQPPDVLRVRP